MARAASAGRFARFAPFLLLGLLVARSAPADELYGVDFSVSEIYTIDLATGAATLVSATSLSGLAGIAFDDDDKLYAIDVDFGSTTLYLLHPATGASTAVGTTGTTAGEGALVYDPVADVFWSKANAISGGGATLELISIDPSTGLATTIGNMGLALEADVTGLELLPDDTLIAFDPQSALADRMLTIDKTTAAATVIGSTGEPDGSSVGGLARDPDTGIYYMSDGVQLFTVDSTTGNATPIGPHGENISGLSFGHPPTCILGTDDTGTLHDVTATNGTGVAARPTGVTFLGGLALASTGKLYTTGTAGNGVLYEIDIPTGTATSVGSTGISLDEGGLDFDPVSGDLYGVNGDGGKLFTLDVTTGAATTIGEVRDAMGGTIDASGLAFDSAGNLFVLKTGTAPEIYEVDPSDASVSSRVPIQGFPAGVSLGGMEFDDATGTLYAILGSDLVIVNPHTGASIVVGPTPIRSGLEIVTSCSAGTMNVPTLGGPGVALLVLVLLGVAAWAARAAQRGDRRLA